MQLSEKYYQATNGPWQGQFQVELLSLKLLLKSPIGIVNKFGFIGSILFQKFLGNYDAFTRIDFNPQNRQVKHITKLSKWGICLYKGEEVINLKDNGKDLAIDGDGYYWAIWKREVNFRDCHGYIESVTEAVYRIPFLNVMSETRTKIDGNSGIITSQTDWARGTFRLKKVESQ